MQQSGVCWQEPQHSTSQVSLLYHWLQRQNAWHLQRDCQGGMHGQLKQHPKTLPLQASPSLQLVVVVLLPQPMGAPASSLACFRAAAVHCWEMT
jgi:hypothetical protein